MSDMADLEKMSLLELEEIATKLRHAIARNPLFWLLVVAFNLVGMIDLNVSTLLAWGAPVN